MHIELSDRAKRRRRDEEVPVLVADTVRNDNIRMLIHDCLGSCIHEI